MIGPRNIRGRWERERRWCTRESEQQLGEPVKNLPGKIE